MCAWRGVWHVARLPGEKRREQLLTVALELFSTLGYARTTTAELAKAAGVTEPIIYRHFKSKRELFVALIRRTAERTLAYWEESLADAQDPAQRLRRLLGENPMVSSEEGHKGYLVFLQAIAEVEDELIVQAVRDHIRDLHAFLSREIRQAQMQRKVPGAFSAELIAWALIHSGLGYGVLQAMRIPGQGTDEKGRHVRDVIGLLLVGRPRRETAPERAPERKSRGERN